MIFKKIVTWFTQEKIFGPEPAKALDPRERLIERLEKARRLRDHNRTMCIYWEGLVHILDSQVEAFDEDYIHVLNDGSYPSLDTIKVLILEDDETVRELTTREAIQKLFYRCFTDE